MIIFLIILFLIVYPFLFSLGLKYLLKTFCKDMYKTVRLGTLAKIIKEYGNTYEELDSAKAVDDYIVYETFIDISDLKPNYKTLVNNDWISVHTNLNYIDEKEDIEK